MKPKLIQLGAQVVNVGWVPANCTWSCKKSTDHPHGGGEGKTSGGRPSVSPWGKPAHGVPTSRSKNKLILVKRKKMGRVSWKTNLLPKEFYSSLIKKKRYFFKSFCKT